MGKMELQRFRLLCVFLFVTVLVVHGPSTTYADEPEPSPCVIPRPILSPIPAPPLAATPNAPLTPPSTSIPPAPTPSENDD